MNNLHELVDLLNSGLLRVSTGLWLLPTSYLDHEEDEAYRLNLEPVDLRQRLLKELEPDTKYANLSSDQVFRLVDNVSREYGDWAGALIFNLDLLIARLSTEDRNIIWEDLFTALPHRRRSVLLTLPETATNLLPSEKIIRKLEQENRLFGVTHYQF